MEKKKVLFICVHNSARSLMAEALLNQMCGDEFEAQSAGLTPGRLREIGIDISRKETRSVFDVWKSGQVFAYVITVCDEASAEQCPVFPGVTTRLHWRFPDPSTFEGTWEERLERTRRVRDMIRAKIEEWCRLNCLNTVA
ncbi:MAG: arsenate reductase ArsC [Candidatus Dadabacteria bacterium]